MLREVKTTVAPTYNEVFADRLRVLLRRKFGGSLPKAAELAAALGDRSLPSDAPRVSAESVRRWMRGISVPEALRLTQLCQALDLVPSEVCYLLMIDGANVRGGARALYADSAPWPTDVRAALHEWIDTVDDGALSGAYLGFLLCSKAHHFGAGGGSVPYGPARPVPAVDP